MQVQQRAAENTIWGKVVASPESKPWWVKWIQGSPRLVPTPKGCRMDLDAGPYNWVSLSLFLVYPGAFSTPLSPPLILGACPESQKFRNLSDLAPIWGELGTWERLNGWIPSIGIWYLMFTSITHQWLKFVFEICDAWNQSFRYYNQDASNKVAFNDISSPTNLIVIGLSWLILHNPRVDWHTKSLHFDVF